jgi:hypothetical protein
MSYMSCRFVEEFMPAVGERRDVRVQLLWTAQEDDGSSGEDSENLLSLEVLKLRIIPKG